LVGNEKVLKFMEFRYKIIAHIIICSAFFYLGYFDKLSLACFNN